MIITGSLALILGIATGALVYFGRVTAATALLAWLSGFTAASTGLAGPVNDLLTAAVTAISGH